MICYLCGSVIPDDQPFYNDHGVQVCKPCFKDARRCFVCRFPGQALADVEGLGLECEFCRGNLIAEGSPVAPLLEPVAPFLAAYGIKVPENPPFVWVSRQALREMQTEADLPPEEFIDDFLRFCYPVYYRAGQYHCLRRMTRATFVVYSIVQLAAGRLATVYGQPDLAGGTPFHAYARGFCHYLGFEAARRLDYDLERRQLRKWPELGAQGDFDAWVNMARHNKPPKLAAFFQANLRGLARKHLAGGRRPGAATHEETR